MVWEEIPDLEFFVIAYEFDFPWVNNQQIILNRTLSLVEYLLVLDGFLDEDIMNIKDSKNICHLILDGFTN